MIRGNRSLVLVSPLLIAMAAISAARAQSQANFGDWSAGCDNTLYCSAIGFAANQTDPGWLKIDREPASGAAARIRIVLDFETADKEIPVEAKFDEPGFESIFAAPLKALKDGNERHLLNVPASAQAAFLQALRKAGTLTIRRLDAKPASDTAEVRLSLKGSVAALRWLDERQRRAGTETALIASGAIAGSAIPRPPAPPTVRRARYAVKALEGKQPPAAVIAAWKEACDEWDEYPDMKGEGHEIAPQTQLWLMPCSRGAYNFNSNAILLKGTGNAQLLKLDSWKSAEQWSASRFEQDQEEITNASFDPQTMSINFFSKGRGIGDCGSSGAYTWDGTRFRMTEYSLMGECRGVPLDDWFRLWRTTVTK